MGYEISSDSLINLIKQFVIVCKNAVQGSKPSIFSRTYHKTNIKVSLYARNGGNSRYKNVPTFAFLNYNQTISNGICPIIFFDRKTKKDNFSIAYSISTTKKPQQIWNDSILEKGVSNPQKSLYYTYFLTVNSENDIDNHKDEIINIIDDMIDDFHIQFGQKPFFEVRKPLFNTTKKSFYNGVNNMKNLILYGPPGTGKTYNTTIEAMKILDSEAFENYEKTKDYEALKVKFNDLKKKGQAEFVTFHPSFAYEEFIEGIKPDLDDNWNEAVDKLSYIGYNGIFKTISNRALFDRLDINENKQKEITDFKNLKEMFIQNYELGSVLKTDAKGAEFRIDKYTPNSIRVTRISGIEYTYSITYKYLEEAFNKKIKSQQEMGQIKGVANGLTGYYYTIYNKMLKFSITHEIYNIEDISDEEKSQYLKDYYEGKISLKKEGNGTPYVLIIDEINRGDISKIFGELITLIEDDKRENLTVKLPYSKELFTIPKNLYIIGTMNTSDRSIAAIDIALRRRFKFKEIMPEKKLVADFGIGFSEIFESINNKIKFLLDRNHQIGHSYFIKTKYNNSSVKTLKEIWFTEIIPLLNEYFYCDWEKLNLVIPSFIRELTVPEKLQNECDNKIYEFITFDEMKIENFTEAIKQLKE